MTLVASADLAMYAVEKIDAGEAVANGVALR